MRAKSIKDYLASLPPDRREAVQAVLAVIRRRLPKGYEEGIQYGMPAFFVPHSVYPQGYHCSPAEPLPFASVASQKGHMAFYAMGIYMSDELRNRFVEDWKKSGKRLDMGKSCVRFKKLEDVPLEVIGAAVARLPVKKYIALYEEQLQQNGTRKKSTRKKASKKTASKKKVSKKASSKKKTSKKKASKKKTRSR